MPVIIIIKYKKRQNKKHFFLYSYESDNINFCNLQFIVAEHDKSAFK